MKIFYQFLLVFSILQVSFQDGCDLSKPVTQDHVTSPLPYTYIDSDILPVNFTYENVNGVNLVTRAMNQYVPRACMSCWAMAVTGALSDRLKIAYNASRADINIAPQILLNHGTAGTCFGGDKTEAYQWIHENGITDEPCMPYEAVFRTRWGEVNPATRFCYQCGRFGNCSWVPYYKYHIDEYGEYNGTDMENKMMTEIYARGPIACSIMASDAFLDYKGGIIQDDFVYENTTHVVTILGWGEQDDDLGGLIQYWIGRNSYGSFWEENNGFFRVQKGNNTLNIETSCSWATPKDETITDILTNNLKPNENLI